MLCLLQLELDYGEVLLALTAIPQLKDLTWVAAGDFMDPPECNLRMLPGLTRLDLRLDPLVPGVCLC